MSTPRSLEGIWRAGAGPVAVGCLLLALACQPAGAQPAPKPTPEGERPQLLARQAMLTESFDREAADCRSRFVVTSCLEDVARRRRAALEPLRERLLQLDEAQRQQRAQARREAVAARELQRQRQLAEAAAQAPGAASAPGPRQRMLPPVSSAAPRAAQAASQAEARAQAAQQRAAEAQRRAEQGAQRQQRVRRKLEQRAAEGRPLQPLPAAPEKPQP
jgi:hypothetical protein